MTVSQGIQCESHGRSIFSCGRQRGTGVYIHSCHGWRWGGGPTGFRVFPRRARDEGEGSTWVKVEHDSGVVVEWVKLGMQRIAQFGKASIPRMQHS